MLPIVKIMEDLKAEIKNGRLIIESKTEKGSKELDKWIEENRQWLSHWLDIDIKAH
jgi:hypothetical protein